MGAGAMERIRERVGTGTGILGAILVAAGGAGAQERPLGAPTAVHDASFAVVNSVRELADGRVLVADPLATVLVLLDADLQAADTLGGLGEGPDEYRQPDAVWALPGDSTLLVDLGNARLTALGPDGTFGPTQPIARGDWTAGPPPIAIPGGVDGSGALYFTGMPAMGPRGPSDTVPLFRMPRDGEPRSVTRLKTTEFTSSTTGSATNQSVSIQPIPLSPTDVWAPAPDGAVFVARAGERRVDRVAPDGTVRRGPTVEVDDVPVGRDEKEEWAAARESSGGGIGIEMTDVNGERSMRMSRGGGGDLDLDAMTWPDEKGPWVDRTGAVDPRGRFWVRRSLPAGEAALYDVFDQDLRRTLSIRFPADRVLVGFGREAVYAVHIDAFDLKTLERYPLPTP